MVSPAQRETIFTKRLKEARVRAGLTQMQLGVLAGIEEDSASARMNQYERGVHAPEYGTAQRLAHALNIPTSYLFEENNALAQLILTFGNLKSNQREQVQKFIDETLSSDTGISNDKI